MSTPRKSITHVYDAAYTGTPNWDIGRPQRPFVRFAEADLVEEPVLDVGCGTGELSLYLARRGHRVLGIDLSAVAVGQAREKAYWRGVDAQFLVHDALELPGLADAGLSFRTVVDCAMFHVLHAADRDRFVSGLGAVLRPGGRYVVLGDARRDDSGYGVDPAEFRARFERAEGWAVEFVHETVFERRYSENPAYFACVRRE